MAAFGASGFVRRKEPLRRRLPGTVTGTVVCMEHIQELQSSPRWRAAILEDLEWKVKRVVRVHVDVFVSDVGAF